jgi:hypothetical protein
VAVVVETFISDIFEKKKCEKRFRRRYNCRVSLGILVFKFQEVIFGQTVSDRHVSS